MALTWQFTSSGNIKDTRAPQQNVVGMVVDLKKAGVVVDQDTTDSSGNYSVTYAQTQDVPATFTIAPQAKAPHFAAPSAQNYVFDSTKDESIVRNFTSTFSNSNPTRQTVGNQSFEDNSGSYTVTKSMSDPNSGDVLTPTKLTGPAFGALTKLSSTQYRWSFNTAAASCTVGGHSFSYKIEDDWGGSSSTESFTVTITPANTAPVLTNPGTKTYTKGTGDQTFQLTATDAEDDDLTFARTAGQTWATTDNDGLVTVDTDTATKGTFSHTWRVSDGSLTDSETHNIVIENATPVLTEPGNQIYVENSGNKGLQLVSTDSDGDTPTYSKQAGEAWGTVSSTTGLITFDIDSVAIGDYEFTFRVSDGTAFDEVTFTVSIVTAVPAPMFGVIA